MPVFKINVAVGDPDGGALAAVAPVVDAGVAPIRFNAVPPAGTQLAASIQRYPSRLDRGWSRADCAGFLVMEKRSTTDTLIYDRDFEPAGLRALCAKADAWTLRCLSSRALRVNPIATQVCGEVTVATSGGSCQPSRVVR